MRSDLCTGSEWNRNWVQGTNCHCHRIILLLNPFSWLNCQGTTLIVLTSSCSLREPWSMVCSSVRKTNRLIASHCHRFGPCWWPLSRCSMAVAALAALSQSNLVHSPRLSRIAGAFAWVTHWSWTDFHIFQRTSVGGCYTALSSYILFVNCRSIG